MTMRKKRAELLQTATLVLDYILSVPQAAPDNPRRDWLAPPPLSAFKRLEPCNLDDIGVDVEDHWLFADTTPDVNWPIDVSSIVSHHREGVGLVMDRVRSIDTKQARGLVTHFSKYMVRVDHAQEVDGELTTCASVGSWLNKKWVDAKGRNDMHDSFRHVFFLLGMALRQRYEWAVCVGLPNAPSIRFATDPTGVKELFRLRDTPTGSDRRDALLTWVSNHWREQRTDPDMEVYVRRHLRGATSFTWKGFEVELVPAKFDLEQRDKLMEERQRMHEVGTDRRRKT